MTEKLNIKTGYFSKLKEYEKKGYVAISISKYPPKWFRGLKYPTLAPSKLSYDSLEAYCTAFDSKLSRLNPNIVINQLKALSNSQPIVLLCYEKPNEFCHRHLVADWIESKLEIKVLEIGHELHKRGKGTIILSSDNSIQTKLF